MSLAGEVTVTGFANGGAGVAHDADGRVVFVRGALPGERVSIAYDDQRASFAKAHVVEVIEASEHRVDPLCPAAAAGAGCCDLAYAEPGYAARLRADALADVLRRIGRFTPGDGRTPEAPGLRALADDPTGWRVRTRPAVGPSGEVGLRVRGSADLITVPCAGPVPTMLTGLADLGARPGTELAVALGSDGARHVAELAPAAPVGGGRGRRADGRGRRADGRGRRAAQSARGRRSAARSTRLLDGAESVTQELGGHRWEVPVTGFWQAHRAAPEAYARTVREMVAQAGIPDRPLRVWDLYGGAGVLGAALLDGAADGGPAVAGIELVETDAGALAAAERALAGEPVRIRRGDVAGVVADLPAPDVVIADPPRAGAGAAVIEAVTGAAPRVVIHIGCDAGAFARDLRDYVERGYRVLDWRAFDAFPLTHHVEAIALLTGP
ncbi:MAG: TRAM domain-containing protein [Gordonia sp. (in: high G+C Gram-positive bacteria)]|uniref:class I SAM-dependent RNA methyltransferase n=1 Tax=Gordonia sp. (in: high G+C Gram-positive bacteria) TaxID=84139 RepID=UPI0039E5DE78